MTDAFISYQRKPSASLAMLIQEKLANKHNLDCYLDTTRRDSTQVQFPERLMKAIEKAPIFICLLGDTTLESEWVLKEIRKAHKLEKFCIPVFQESYKKPQTLEPSISYLLNHDGVHIFDQKNIYINTAVRDIAELIPRKSKSFFWTKLLLALIGILFLIGFLTGSFYNVIQQVSNIIIDNIQTEQSVSLDSTEFVVASPNSIIDEFPVEISTEIQMSPTSNEVTIETIASPEPIDPIQLALRGVETNDEWTPHIYRFDDIDMVLVPRGCLRIGNIAEDTRPPQVICFENPFWIDKFEVSNGQFSNFNGVSENDNYHTSTVRPRENLTWVEARDFCYLRDSRLPTEIEWEYAARGVDGLIYPWGNGFIQNRASYLDTSFGQTSIISDFELGKSWVDAYNMLGNVSEWTNSQFLNFPYDRLDGREDSEESDILRIMRGGSWNNGRSQLSTILRGRNYPSVSSQTVGFRCVRDFNPDELE